MAPNAKRDVGRALTGIPGFDALTQGLPRGRPTLLIGGPGCGKTIFALQCLVEGARREGEPGIFVAFEERSREIQANAASFGWDLAALQRKKLFFLDAHLDSGTVLGGPFDLAGLLAGIGAKSRKMGARRIVFDGIDMLLSALDDPAAERREMNRLHDWLYDSGLTGILTAKAIGPDRLLSPGYDFVQFMADCVVSLDHRLAGAIATRHLQVLKYRGGSPSTNEFPMAISSHGIEVGVGAELEHAVSNEKVSSGVERLDSMLGGGYFRGSSVLVSGSPGTAKSTLAGSFAEACCRRGEPTIYFSFDEAAQQIVRNLRSVGIRLAPHVKSGLLRMTSTQAHVRSYEEHVLRIRALLEQHRARNLIVDPLSALTTTTEASAARDCVERLITHVKRQGITMLTTSLLEGSDELQEGTAAGVSTIADTWIHLSYVIQAGERNRALTIVKSRGMGHSNQVRELILSDEGVTLADAYSAGGAGLMGTLRWKKEEQARTERLNLEREAEARRRLLEASIAEKRERIEALSRDLEGTMGELESLRVERSSDAKARKAGVGRLRRMRHADELPAARPGPPRHRRKSL